MAEKNIPVKTDNNSIKEDNVSAKSDNNSIKEGNVSAKSDKKFVKKNSMSMKTDKITGSTSYLDLLRFIAICAVIMLHTIHGASTVYSDAMTSAQMNVYTSVMHLCAFGVPVFLMISGALILDPAHEMPLKKLFLKKIGKVVLALVIFGTFFSLLEIVAIAGNFRAAYIINAFENMLTGNSWDHLWYLYVLIGLYLLVPLLRPFAEHADRNSYRAILIILFVTTSILPTIMCHTGFELGLKMPVSGIYLFYYLAGYYIREYADSINKIVKKPVIFCIIAAMSVMIVCYISFTENLALDYSSPLIVILSLSIFLLASSSAKEYKICGKFREYVFAIYILHTFWLNLAYKFLGISPLHFGGYILLPVFFIVDLLLSFALAFILRKIPFVKKYIL